MNSFHKKCHDHSLVTLRPILLFGSWFSSVPGNFVFLYSNNFQWRLIKPPLSVSFVRTSRPVPYGCICDTFQVRISDKFKARSIQFGFWLDVKRLLGFRVVSDSVQIAVGFVLGSAQSLVLFV